MLQQIRILRRRIYISSLLSSACCNSDARVTYYGHFLLISCSWSESGQIYNRIARGTTVWTIYNDILLPGHTRRNQRVNAALYGLEYSISYRLEFEPLGFQDRRRTIKHGNMQTWKVY